MKKRFLVAAILVATASANAAVVINEFLQDTDNAGNDAGEFVELYNNGGATVDISGWTLDLINGGTPGTSYLNVTVPAATNLLAGDYYVIGTAATINANYPGVVDQNAAFDNGLQNGSPDGILLRDSTTAVQDVVNYEADGVFFATSPFIGTMLTEGGVGLTRSRVITNTAGQVSCGRLPNGVDTGSNEADFANIHATPGAANTDSITLPFSDSFTTVNAAWKYGFVATRVVDPTTANHPGSFSPDGGNCLEVGDSTGGGDANWLPAALNLVNVEGYIFIPPDNAAPWSIGVGVAERSNTNWFSPSIGNGMENGYYLEYENGTVVGGKANVPGAATASARLIAVNSTPTINTGATTASVGTVLGTTTGMVKNAWNSFRIGHDAANSRVYASINGVVIYDGATVAGSNTSGGVYVGFCERHAGNPIATSAEFLYLDGLVVNTTLPNAAVDNWTILDDK